MKINKILVPTDFSDPAKKAINQAIHFATTFNAEITLLHARVMYSDSIDTLPETKELALEQELLERLKGDTEKYSSLKIKHKVIRGFSVQSAILSYINTNEFDLVIIGTHGKSGIEHFLLGSVAEKIVRYAPYPVITVPPNSIITAKYHKIVVPYDFSDHAQLALERASFFATISRCEFDILYVIEDRYNPLSDNFYSQSSYKEVVDVQDMLKTKLAKIISKLPNSSKLKYQISTKSGKAHKKIAEYVKEVDADLVIMATHGLVGIDRFILGSTTERVIRSINSQILSLKLKNYL